MLVRSINGVSGNFAVASNWMPADVPMAGDDAEINATDTCTVSSLVSETVDSLSTIATTTLALGGNSTFTMSNGTGAGQNAGTIAIGDGSELAADGTVDNTGKITLAGA